MQPDTDGSAYLLAGAACYLVSDALLLGIKLGQVGKRDAAARHEFQDFDWAARKSSSEKSFGSLAGRLAVAEKVDEAVRGTNFVYTDVWLSMGEDEAAWGERIRLLTRYRVTREVMTAAGNPYVKFMHCLPSFHNTETEVGADIGRRFGIDCMEVTDEIFESRASVVFEQAENRLHTIKAILVATIGA